MSSILDIIDRFDKKVRDNEAHSNLFYLRREEEASAQTASLFMSER